MGWLMEARRWFATLFDPPYYLRAGSIRFTLRTWVRCDYCDRVIHSDKETRFLTAPMGGVTRVCCDACHEEHWPTFNTMRKLHMAMTKIGGKAL